MQYRQLGNTELRLSELSLGTVALGMPYGVGEEARGAGAVPPPTDSEAVALIHHAIDRGLNFFDTARAYGRSEELLGKALRDRRHKVLVATKIACRYNDGGALPRRELTEQMAGSLHTSLRLLGTDHVDLLLLHSVSNDLLKNSGAIALVKRFQLRAKRAASRLQHSGSAHGR